MKQKKAYFRSNHAIGIFIGISAWRIPLLAIH